MTTSYVLFGSNKGNKAEIFGRACGYINERCGMITAVSSSYETEPWGFDSDKWFLNRLVVLETSLLPDGLMHELLAIEKQLGRVRGHNVNRYVSRPIDLDILYYGEAVLHEETLTLPHPRLHLRRFALLPMCEVAPDFEHPVLHRTQTELLAECPDQSMVKCLKN
ncbi:2-amino-4-hydroxy-6-hydroxymethyldihydropteridine diphosphokinase [Bacteroides heparinolyticus]|uniref:2-amino-4-hydroxy-6- hydroxymethyldihydropteridine diphosphokinase n=1 Tax=Prevotella heparinolytica TaxID=28113 RepID=UPI00359FD59C